MRVGFGLVSILVVVGLILYISSKVDVPTVEAGKRAQNQAEQISGRDENGVPAYKSYSAQEYGPGGHFQGIQITSLIPNGPMEKGYGLKTGDVVLQIGGMDATTLGDYNSAKGQLDQAYQSAAALTVLRDGAKINLKCKGPLSDLLPQGQP